jgi:hypothetical protein
MSLFSFIEQITRRHWKNFLELCIMKQTLFLWYFRRWHKKTHSLESFELSDICSSVCVVHTEKWIPLQRFVYSANYVLKYKLMFFVCKT